VIDWQVTVDGQLPEGWDQHKDGCWFPDFDTQLYLLPYFNVGDKPIDEYGSTVFDIASIERLRTHLQRQCSYLEGKEPLWRITETSAQGSHSYEVRRDVVISIIDKTVEMIGVALKLNGQLLFRGD
jgi:hypothetical protein